VDTESYYLLNITLGCFDAMNHKRLLPQMIGLTLVLLLSTACGTPQYLPSSTSVPPTLKPSPVPPTATNTLPPPTNTNTPVTPTSTHTPVPPTATPTATSVIQPLAGDWSGSTDEGFPISFTIIIEDDNVTVKYLIIRVEYDFEGTTLKFTYVPNEKLVLENGIFESSDSYINISGKVIAPDKIEGIANFYQENIVDINTNWTASPKIIK